METIFTELTARDIENEILNLSQLVFEVTDGCNLKCKYCGYGEMYTGYDKRMSKKLPFVYAKNTLDYIVDLWIKNNRDYEHNFTVSFYGGEPLLNVPLIKQIQNYIESRFSGYILPVYSMTTNGILLDKYMDFIAQKNFRLLVSLDGDRDAQSYRIDYKGRNSFDKVYANLKRFESEYPDYFKENVRFNSVLHNRNSTAGIYDFFKHEFGKPSAVSELNTSGIDAEKREEFNTLFVNKNNDFYRSGDSRKMTDEMFYDVPEVKMLYLILEKFSGNIFKSYSDLLYDKKTLRYTPSGTCLPFSRKMYITVNGKILPCERINQQNSLGTVDDHQVILDFESVAKFYNDLFARIKEKCAACCRLKICTQCLFYLEKMNDGLLCKGFMNEKEFQSLIKENKRYLKENPHLYKRIIDELVII